MIGDVEKGQMEQSFEHGGIETVVTGTFLSFIDDK